MKFRIATAALLPSLLLTACGVSTKTLGTQKVTGNPVIQSEATPTPSPQSNSTEITVPIASIINQDFYYGLDLVNDPSSTQIERVGVFFRVDGNELHLVVGDSATTVIDATHPEQVISVFNIISETPTDYVLSTANSAQYIATALGANASASKEVWARSFEYLPSGNLFFQNTVIVLSNGSKVEVIENISPKTPAPLPTISPAPTATPSPTATPVPSAAQEKPAN